MLTADLVHARRTKGDLALIPLGARREDAIDLARTVIDLARDHHGRTREELEEAWSAIDVEPRNRKLLDGITKLVEDGLSFESELDADPIALRAEVFQRAARARRELGEGEHFDRDAVLAEVARGRGASPDAIARGLFGDLRGAQILRGVGAHLSAEGLVDGYDLAQAQAVLLRATRVVVTLERVDPGALRALLRKLKFLRLLVSVHREDGPRWRLEIDGPFSLFESVTKYGLALALALPSIVACGEHTVVADVRWGKERLPLRFTWRGARSSDALEPRLSDDAEALRARLEAREGPFRVAVADVILDLPGTGACVPDLVLTHRKTKKRAYVEVMGYWSRDAVWKRVEMVEAGLLGGGRGARGAGEPVLFCVGERLRVSEAALPEGSPAALLVYKGVIPAGVVEERALALLGIGKPR